jgi:hypothetical protein
MNRTQDNMSQILTASIETNLGCSMLHNFKCCQKADVTEQEIFMILNLKLFEAYAWGIIHRLSWPSGKAEDRNSK